jgi:ABC-type Fe3+-hydroxamate transport system substrate-binding protein
MILKSPAGLTHPASRIISLVPSQTELLYYLGLEKEVVGITKFCIHPAHWYRNKIRVGGTKTIDNQILMSLSPDLIIANKEENMRSHIEALAADFPVWVTDVNNLEDALQMISDVGQLTNRQKEARLLVQEIGLRFSSLNQSPPIPACYLIWKEPYMAAGADTFINDMMEKSGFQNVFSNKTRYPEVTIDEICAAAPRIIMLSSEPYPFAEKHIEELQHNLPGIKCVLVDGELFSWYGSRLLQAPAYFKKIYFEANGRLQGKEIR